MKSMPEIISACSPAFAMLFAILSVNLLPLRQDRRALRLLGCALLVLGVIALVLLIPEGRPWSVILKLLYYYGVYLAIGFSLVVCCEGSAYEAAYVTVIGQLWQHLLYSLSSIVFTALAMGGHAVDQHSPAVTLTVLFAYAAAYLAMYLLLPRFLRNRVSLAGNTGIMISGLILPIPLTLMNLLITSLTQEPLNLLYFRVYASLICLAAYFMLISVQHNEVAHAEMARIRQASLLQKERYEFRKEAIERVNLRAHDLKKQLARMEAGALCDRKALEEIRRELSEYEELADTGSEALDIILTDAAVRCREAGIRLSYLVDGAALGFVDAIDLYAIFGNLLDNAITAAAAVKEPENRMVSLKMRQAGDLLYFHLFNTFENAVQFDGAFPKTTKPDAEDHGFGMKSAGAALKKYGGEMLITVKEQVFNVNFMLKKR